MNSIRFIRTLPLFNASDDRSYRINSSLIHKLNCVQTKESHFYQYLFALFHLFRLFRSLLLLSSFLSLSLSHLIITTRSASIQKSNRPQSHKVFTIGIRLIKHDHNRQLTSHQFQFTSLMQFVFITNLLQSK
jgi:hypothetical protein